MVKHNFKKNSLSLLLTIFVVFSLLITSSANAITFDLGERTLVEGVKPEIDINIDLVSLVDVLPDNATFNITVDNESQTFSLAELKEKPVTWEDNKGEGNNY